MSSSPFKSSVAWERVKLADAHAAWVRCMSRLHWQLCLIVKVCLPSKAQCVFRMAAHGLLHLQEYSHLLPQRVVAPGEPVAPVTAEVARRTGLQEGCMVCGGTTGDSCCRSSAFNCWWQHKAAGGVHGVRRHHRWVKGSAPLVFPQELSLQLLVAA